ncbi:hypothetical protein LEP1GSC050_1362 [Leptospira broomii serovar Hurstbridge str. 5399]|uniref:Uncharacterized protein n=1 Tax=Leptospira broomii serovar Hurstbridge str. 5399 TaxID=1049789 RepID=T0GCX8_9LEPT|nr:hypothetical protein LEP1GSC050_1362 [Leptospira broomii serovar Hurstbridge str. 5399]
MSISKDSSYLIFEENCKTKCKTKQLERSILGFVYLVCFLANRFRRETSLFQSEK